MANIFVEAKKISKQHPRLDWQECIQRASKKHKPKKVGAVKKKSNRQTGSSNKKHDQERSARPPGARVPRGGTVVTYYERRKNRSDVPGKLTGVTAGRLASELKRRLKDKLAKELLAKDLTPKKSLKKRYQKLITETRSRLKRLSS